MNNAKMWLVVKPTVGIPLFLGGVAVTSLAVHVAVISSGVGSWYGPYVAGDNGAEGSAAVQTEQSVMPASVAASDLPAYLEADSHGNETVRVLLPDGRTATLVVDDLTSAALIE
jgi:light-harvesting protein B-800-850 alpha chain